MTNGYGLRRDLAQSELPGDATEALEEARRVARTPLPGGRAGGSEQRAGTEPRPLTPPTATKRPEFNLPPFELPKKP